jgi:hypothetical protein
MRTLLSSGHGAGVHSHVPLSRVAVGRPRCVGPIVGTSGGGGLARRATTTSVAVAVLAVVAAIIITIAVFVIVLVLIAIGAAVFVIGRARRRGRPGTQRWCRAPSGQPEARYYPCESPPVAFVLAMALNLRQYSLIERSP